MTTPGGQGQLNRPDKSSLLFLKTYDGASARIAAGHKKPQGAAFPVKGRKAILRSASEKKRTPQTLWLALLVVVDLQRINQTLTHVRRSFANR
jgi:hypothetical protein